MPLKIDPPQLLAEAGALLHGGAEFILAENVGVERGGRHDRGVARLAADQRQFAEELGRAEPRYLMAPALDLDLALRDQKQLAAHVALADDDIAGIEMTPSHLLGDVGQLRRGERFEGVDPFEE